MADEIKSEQSQSGNKLPPGLYTTWHRVYRNEPRKEGTFFGHLGSPSAVDIVHRDFFETYLTQHVMPFANEFARLALRHNHELATGKAFASGFGADSGTNIEQRIVPAEIKKGPPTVIPPNDHGRKKSKKR